MVSFYQKHQGFTLIELMIGILIFAVGMAGIFALIQTSITASSQIRHEIVAANLMREQIELVRNLRDTNVKNFLPWDSIYADTVGSTFLTGGYYTIENNFSSPTLTLNVWGQILTSPISIKNIIFPSESIEDRFATTRLSRDNTWRYTHSVTGTWTVYASYIKTIPLEIPRTPSPIRVEYLSKTQAYRIEAHVIVSTPRFREYELVTIITDWIK
jgi:prepilin-type N-terminal cleavage/methylation domain-containing protein